MKYQNMAKKNQQRKSLVTNKIRLLKEAELAREQAALDHIKSLQQQELAHQAILLSNSDALLYGKINGILEAFSFFVQAANAGHTFEFKSVEKPRSLEEALKKYYQDWEQENAPYSLVELSNPKGDLQQLLDQWLFSYVVYHSESCDYQQNYPHWRDLYVAQLAELMLQVAKPSQVWKVGLEPLGFYECTWDDYVLEGPEHIFVLHLGVSD